MEYFHWIHHHFHFDLSTIDPFTWAGFAAIFSYSGLTSVHCVGMCGPLACAITTRRTSPSGRDVALYNLSRVISYTLGGAIFGWIGEQLAKQSFVFGSFLSIVLGSALVIYACALLFAPHVRISLPAAFKKLPQIALSRISSWSRSWQSLGLGMLTIFLPCMTLHPLLLAAAGTRSALAGALSMCAFALGTVPAMVSATYMPSLVPVRVRSKIFVKLGPILLVLVGALTIWRGLGA